MVAFHSESILDETQPAWCIPAVMVPLVLRIAFEHNIQRGLDLE
jgi:hypothetical protein